MVFLFYGPNSFAARRQIRDMAATYRRKSGSDFGLERIDGAETNPASLSASLLAAPFLAKSRLVIVDEVSRNQSAAAAVLKLLDQIPSSTVAVFYEPAIDQRTVFFKVIKDKATDIKFDPLGQSALVAWIKRRAAVLGTEIDPESTRILIDRAGDDQWRLEGELIKLANSSDRIGPDEVRALVAPNFSQNIFDLIDAMSAGQTKAALMIYQGLKDEQMAELYILTMIIWQLRNLLLAKLAGPLPANDLARRTGMSAYVATKAAGRSRAITETGIRRAFLTAVEADYNIKTGRVQADQAVETLITAIASAKL